MSCTTDLPLANRRPDVEVFLVHDDVLPFPSRIKRLPHALVFTPRPHPQRRTKPVHRFITMLIAVSSRLLLILAAERSRCSETGRGRSDEALQIGGASVWTQAPGIKTGWTQSRKVATGALSHGTTPDRLPPAIGNPGAVATPGSGARGITQGAV